MQNLQKCPGCGETIVELLFNLPRCINPRCKHFNKKFLRKFVFNSEPIHCAIDQHGWTHPFYLGPFGNYADETATIYDLWYVEPTDGDACFIAQYGGNPENCYWNKCQEIRDTKEIRNMFPELDEAMRRFDALLS